jgi:hypothetical protein
MTQVNQDGQPNELAKLYSQKEFIKAMRIGRDTFFSEVKAGRIKCYKINRRWYISHQAAAEWIRSKESSGGLYTA